MSGTLSTTCERPDPSERYTVACTKSNQALCESFSVTCDMKTITMTTQIIRPLALKDYPVSGSPLMVPTQFFSTDLRSLWDLTTVAKKLTTSWHGYSTCQLYPLCWRSVFESLPLPFSRFPLCAELWNITQTLVERPHNEKLYFKENTAGEGGEGNFNQHLWVIFCWWLLKCITWQ